MTEDFFYALMTGWVILLLFWLTIIIFILIRKPPKSKLTFSIILKSLAIFLGLLIVIYLLK